MIEHRVFLDHLIERENLRYQRSREQLESTTQNRQDKLRITDLVGDHLGSQVDVLRKPDFQRTTWAWNAEDCVSLLESIVNDQVVPSIIMWRSPDNGLNYVLDGAHRISVIRAWLTNDWGDRLPSSYYVDQEQEMQIKQAARTVRQLIQVKIGSFEDYKKAGDELNHANRNNLPAREALGDITYQRAMAYSVLNGGAGFHILWVTGNYEKAEQSFLKINKSGRQLTEWEKILVENRNSSFVRAVMSLSNLTTAQRYWPEEISTEVNREELSTKVKAIHAYIEEIHTTLFQPPHRRPIVELRQPLLVAPDSQAKPFYLAEFLTITEKYKGQEIETKKLIERDKDASPTQLVESGYDLLNNAKESLNHLVGQSPKSLSLAPALYFYSDTGRYVRSLLYGMLYWLLSGKEDEILTRKRLFSAYRGSFELIIKDRKRDVVTGLTRRTGSGPEITVQTASYYQSLLEELVKHKGDISSDKFAVGYNEMIRKLTNQRIRFDSTSISQSRNFTPSQRASLLLEGILESSILCGICEGILDLKGGVQHDHETEHSQGGATSSANQRIVHPFCNNNRRYIEGIQKSTEILNVPIMLAQSEMPTAQQLTFFNDDEFLASIRQ